MNLQQEKLEPYRPSTKEHATPFSSQIRRVYAARTAVALLTALPSLVVMPLVLFLFTTSTLALLVYGDSEAIYSLSLSFGAIAGSFSAWSFVLFGSRIGLFRVAQVAGMICGVIVCTYMLAPWLERSLFDLLDTTSVLCIPMIIGGVAGAIFCSGLIGEKSVDAPEAIQHFSSQ